MHGERTVTANIMARMLRVPLAWLKAEADAGNIPHVRAGRAYLFVPDVVERIIVDRGKHENVRVNEKPVKLITPFELDALLTYPRGRSARLARQGLIPHLKLPDGELRFELAVIRTWLEELTNKARPAGAEVVCTK